MGAWHRVLARFACSVAVSCFALPAAAAEREAPAKPDDSARLSGIPLAGHAPETGWFFGGFVAYHFPSPRAPDAPAPRRSSLGLVALYSLKSQFVLSLEPTLYLQGGRYRVRGSVVATRFPDTYYAIGPDSPAGSAEAFQQHTFGLDAIGEWRAVGELYVGFQIDLGLSDITRVEPGRELASGRVLGAGGGRVLGAGPLLSWDDRDSEGFPTRGGRYQLSWTTYPTWLGSQLGFFALALDLRSYFRVAFGSVLAVQVYSRHTGGSVPFQLLSALAGDGRMRGFLASRYIDRHVVSAQVEYRVPLFWRLGVCGFLGAGEVAPRLGELDLGHVKLAGGPGLRVALNPEDGINARLDVGLSSDGDTNLYVLIGEAF